MNKQPVGKSLGPLRHLLVFVVALTVSVTLAYLRRKLIDSEWFMVVTIGGPIVIMASCYGALWAAERFARKRQPGGNVN